MKELHTVEEVDQFIHNHQLSFVYVYGTHCSVCHALLPQVLETLKEFPLIQIGLVNAEEVTEIAGYLSVFTIPVLALFVDGKEVLREARFVHIHMFREKVQRIYEGVLSLNDPD